MVNQIVIIVLSSSVIAATISALLTFIQNRKNSNLQYITSERKELREKLRSLAEEVRAANCGDVIDVLIS